MHVFDIGLRVRKVACLQVTADASGAAEPVDAFWERCGRAWSMLQAAAHEEGGKTVAVVTHSSVISGILCRCLELGPADLSLFRTGGGSLSLIGFPGDLPSQTTTCCRTYAQKNIWVLGHAGS